MEPLSPLSAGTRPFAANAYTPFHAVLDSTQQLSGRDVVDIWHVIKASFWRAILRTAPAEARALYRRHHSELPVVILADLELGSLHLRGCFAALLLTDAEAIAVAAADSSSAQDLWAAIDAVAQNQAHVDVSSALLVKALQQEVDEARNLYGFQVAEVELVASTIALRVQRYVATATDTDDNRPQANPGSNARPANPGDPPGLRSWYG